MTRQEFQHFLKETIEEAIMQEAINRHEEAYELARKYGEKAYETGRATTLSLQLRRKLEHLRLAGSIYRDIIEYYWVVAEQGELTGD